MYSFPSLTLQCVHLLLEAVMCVLIQSRTQNTVPNVALAIEVKQQHGVGMFLTYFSVQNITHATR